MQGSCGALCQFGSWRTFFGDTRVKSVVPPSALAPDLRGICKQGGIRITLVKLLFEAVVIGSVARR
jgi:hypothetical protein